MQHGFDPNAPASAQSGIFGLDTPAEQAGVVLIPVPWDVTTSYRPGTSGGPRAILEASRQVDLYDLETGRPYEAGLCLLEEASEIIARNAEGRALAEQVIAAGGNVEGRPELEGALARVNELSHELNAWVESEAERWLAAGRLVGVVGGDHSTPLGAIRAIARRNPGLGVLHIDAHADLRKAYEGFTYSHASIMYNVLAEIPEVATLVQVGIRDFCEAEADLIRESPGRVTTHFDLELKARRFAGQSWKTQCEGIVAGLPERVYVSFDIDGLDPSLCPSTGTPVPGGLSFDEAVYLIGQVAQSGRQMVGFDLNEVSPGSGLDEWDANVGARILYKLIGWSLRSRGPGGSQR